MKIKLLLPIGCALLLLNACRTVYAPALFHQDIAYMPKPASFDKETSSTYVSAGLNVNSASSFDDALVSGQVNLSRGHIFENMNVAYGAFSSFGSYQGNDNGTNSNNNINSKFFGAVGGRFSANAFVNQDRVDFRFIGIEAAYSHEFGDYASYRKQLSGQPGYFVDARTDLFSLGLTTEVIFHNKDNKLFQHGIRGYLGTTFGNNHINNTRYYDDKATERLFRNLYPKASYYMRVKDFFGTMEVGNAFMIRAGYRF